MLKRMKKYLFLLCVLSIVFGFSSCTETKYVTRKSTLDKMVDSLKTQLASEGYRTTGFSTKQTNDMEVVGISYTSKAGFGTAMKNSFVTQDTYTFADSLGNTASYSIFYALDKSDNVEKAGMCGCETSNPQDYEKVCGFISQIDWMPNSDSITVTDTGSVIAIASGIIAAIVILAQLYRAR